MAVDVSTFIWNTSEQKGNALLLMLALADYADLKGECWPAIPTLAKRIRMSEITVRRLLTQLVEAGELEVRKRYDEKGAQQSNGYEIIGFAEWFAQVQQIRKAKPAKGEGVSHHDSPPLSHGDTGGVSHRDTQTINITINEPSNITTVDEKPSVDKPKKTPKPKKRNPMVDSVIEWLFEKQYDQCTKSDKDYAGIVAAWLQGSYKPPNINIDANSYPATPDDVRAIGEAYRRECPDRQQYKALKSLITIAKRWLEMVKERQSMAVEQQKKITDMQKSKQQAMNYLAMVKGVDDEPAAA